MVQATCEITVIETPGTPVSGVFVFYLETAHKLCLSVDALLPSGMAKWVPPKVELTIALRGACGKHRKIYEKE